jgi:hypothetical protein
MAEFLPRTLQCTIDGDVLTLSHDEVIGHPRLAGHALIVLGEAGSGKSELLRHWSNVYGWKFIHAEQIRHGVSLPDVPLLIDGLDELASLREGDGINDLLAKLANGNAKPFALACRVAEWQGATNRERIQRWLGTPPVELFLRDLDPLQQRTFLADQGIDDLKIDQLVSTGTSEWLGNPQTLAMLAKVLRTQNMPATRSALFEAYIDVAWSELRRQDTGLAGATKGEACSALGALFATLLLAGRGTAANLSTLDLRPEDLALSDAASVAGLSIGALKPLLNSRLVKAPEADRYSWPHKQIGEFMAALWLMERASSNRIWARLQSVLVVDGMVPSHLRGLWAWMALDDKRADEIVAIDPWAVIEYGDADRLGNKAAAAMFQALNNPVRQHEDIGWGRHNASALVRPALADQVRSTLMGCDEGLFRLQILLLDQMREAAAASPYKDVLDHLVRDESRYFALRDRAADALRPLLTYPEWASLLSDLAGSRKGDTLRMALELIAQTPSDTKLPLPLEKIAELVFARHGLIPDRVDHSNDTTGVDFLLGDKAIPDDMLGPFLDELARLANTWLDENTESSELDSLALTLISRRLALPGDPEPHRLWAWLSLLSDRWRGRDEKHRRLSDWLKARPNYRRQVLAHALLAVSDISKFRHALFELNRQVDGLIDYREDVPYLIDALPENDPRWRELVHIGPWGPDGKAVRTAARRHVLTPEDEQLLAKHANPPVRDWEKRDAERRRRQDEKERREEAIRKENYRRVADKMDAGDWTALATPAGVYCKMYHSAMEGSPAERLAGWLGEELAGVARAGFLAFIRQDVPPFSGLQISQNHVEGSYYHAAIVTIAGLFELTTGSAGLHDISDDWLQAGFAELVAGLHDQPPFDELRSLIEAELRSRGQLEMAWRIVIEPQLAANRDHLRGLYRLLREEDLRDLARPLAIEWLQKFPDMQEGTEAELIDALLPHAEWHCSLKDLVPFRLRTGELATGRRANWKIVEMVVDATTSGIPSDLANDGEMLWRFRARVNGGWFRDRNRPVQAPPPALAAIVSAYREKWPAVGHPSGVFSGDRNPWDATQFLAACINQLGADTTDVARHWLQGLSGKGDGYDRIVQRALAEQERARINAAWTPLEPESLVRILSDDQPTSHKDLKAVVLEALAEVEHMIISDQFDCWRGFYTDGGDHQPEERCRDHLGVLLQGVAPRFAYASEAHLGNDRETDLWCSTSNFGLPIEIKGQWHKDLWHAPLSQLVAQQAVDHRAQGHGIYLVVWFGPPTNLTGPPRDSGIKAPTSAVELENALASYIRDRAPGIAVKVINVSRPT